VKWNKPPAITNGQPTHSRDWCLDSADNRWRIGKAMVNGSPRYTLARLGGKHPVLVCAGTLEACKAAAHEA
jgi:hypothetical protein